MDLNPGSALRKFLSKEFYQPYYVPFRNWYFSTYESSQVENIKNEYYEYLTQNSCLEHFVPWFLQTYENHLYMLEAHYLNLKAREIGGQ